MEEDAEVLFWGSTDVLLFALAIAALLLLFRKLTSSGSNVWNSDGVNGRFRDENKE